MEIQPPSAELLARLMGAASLRARVIANNIANQNTPGFKRQVVRFEELLGAALSEREAGAAALEPRVETDALTPAGPDGNNVNLELELSALRQNRLLYEAYATILSSHAEVLRAAIEGGR